MFRGGPATFDKLLDKATNNHLLEPDFASIIQISDLIRQGDCAPKYALASIKKKLLNQNSYTVNYALLVLESVVKNCGHLVHDEIATKQFMELLRDLLKPNSSEQVKQKTLEMIQAWSHAFRNAPKYRAVQDMMMTLKAEGHKFPVLKESDAMFAAETAPDWVDADTCHRCRVTFGVVNRKHHCRACGNVFCSQCTSKTSTLPKFGIEKEVRVCETCFEQNKTNRAASPSSKTETEQLPVEYLNSSLAQQKQAPKPAMSAEEMKEEEELNLALALSQSEAEAKEMDKKRPVVGLSNSIQPAKVAISVKEEADGDELELARYMDRPYWEQRQGQPLDRNRSASPDRYRNSPPSAPETPTHQMENGLSDSQLADFVSYLKSQVEIFVNRMKSNSSRGRSISNDSSVQGLFMNMTNNHSKLLEYIAQQEEMRVYFEGLQDKLAQVKDALAALEALRDEHQERLRQEAEEAERLKQIQMAQKLQIMRKKKQEYLQQQRQIAIQRVQEQEREMHMRKEQQKQQYMIGGYSSVMGYAPHGPPGYPPQGPPGYHQQHPGYMPPPGYPHAVIHQGMGLPPHMQRSQMAAGPQSLPPQMQPHMQQMQPPQSLPQQQMGMQHGGLHQQQQSMQQQNPGNLSQQMQQPMPNPGNLQQQMPNAGNLQQQMPNAGNLQQQMSPGALQHSQQPPQSLSHGVGPNVRGPMQQPHSLPPMHAPPGMLQPPYPGIPNQHQVMGQPMGPIQSGIPVQYGRDGVPVQMMSAPQGAPRMMQHGGQQQYQLTPPGAPQEQSTAELIRFD